MKLAEKVNAVRKTKIGYNQWNILYDLEKNGKVIFRDHCKAQSHYNHYCIAWQNLIDDLKKANIPIKIVPGKLGGTWTEQILLPKKYGLIIKEN